MLAEIERNRLEALHAFGVLDTPPEDGFERITALAAGIFDMPIALVSFVDSERQWFKSARGIDVSETPRAHSFCAHTIMDDSPMIIEDAAADPRFCRNPLVTGAPHIRFYAGAPLITEDGHRIGALCVKDRQPRTFGASEILILQQLADCVMSELKVRQSVRLEREAREAAEQALMDRRRIVSTISHEMRTPLNAILGFSELLEGAQLNAEEKQFLEAVRKSGADLAQLLRGLFDKGAIFEGMDAAKNLERMQVPARGEKLRILIVDDMPANLLLMKAFVTRLGHESVLASSGEEAIELSRRNHYDIILMDIQMPTLDGVAAAKIIVSESLGSPPPIIAVTCDTSPENRQDCADAGFTAFMEKPVSLTRLNQVIAAAPVRRLAVAV